MSFKKDGTDPELSRKSILPGLPGGPSWRASVEAAVHAAQSLAASLFDNRGVQPEEVHRYKRSRRKIGRAGPLRRNMLHVSKRVRRKHRRAA